MTNLNIATMTASQGISITGINAGDNTGYSVASAGDVNNDGYADTIIGAFDYGAGAGRAYLIYGGASLTNINLAILTSSQGITIDGINPLDYTGYFVASAGDVNNDGYADIIISSDGYPSGTFVGRAYVIYGGTNLANINLASLTIGEGFSITGINDGDNTGRCVASAGDVNNDGYGDIIIGAYSYPSGTKIGRAYLIYGGASLTNINLANLNIGEGFSITGININDATGGSVASAGDVNNDGYADIIISSDNYPSGAHVGRAYLIYGSSSLSNINLASLIPSQGITIDCINKGDGVAAVASAGDVNNDGFDDMIIGASGYPSGTNVGRAYVIYGSASLTNINLASLIPNQGITIDGINKGEGMAAVASAVDVNNDGYSDIIIGAPNFPTYSSVGRAYVIYGSSSLTNINLASLTSSQGIKNGIKNGDITGWSFASAGDVNGDGNGDIIVGAYGFFSGSYIGRAYIVYGPYSDTLKFYGMFSRVISFTPMNATAPDGTLKTGITDGWCSYASSFVVGDFNGDGKADLLCNSNMPYGQNYIMLSQGKTSKGINFVPPLTADENGFLTMGINNVWCDMRYQRLVAGDFNGDGKPIYFVITIKIKILVETS